MSKALDNPLTGSDAAALRARQRKTMRTAHDRTGPGPWKDVRHQFSEPERSDGVLRRCWEKAEAMDYSAAMRWLVGLVIPLVFIALDNGRERKVWPLNPRRDRRRYGRTASARSCQGCQGPDMNRTQARTRIALRERSAGAARDKGGLSAKRLRKKVRCATAAIGPATKEGSGLAGVRRWAGNNPAPAEAWRNDGLRCVGRRRVGHAQRLQPMQPRCKWPPSSSAMTENGESVVVLSGTRRAFAKRGIVGDSAYHDGWFLAPRVLGGQSEPRQRGETDGNGGLTDGTANDQWWNSGRDSLPAESNEGGRNGVLRQAEG